MNDRPSRRRKLLFGLLAFLMAVGLLEGLSHVALRVVARQADVIRSETHLFDAHRNHRLNPRFQLSDDEAAKIHSEDGLRGAGRVSLVKPTDTIRVLVLGTSALYGIGSRAPYPERPALRNDETITHHLEARLRKRLRADQIAMQVEVLNAGVSAYHTFHHLVYLNSDLLAYRPDIVINFDGHNDFYAETLHDRWNDYAYSTSILVDEFNGRTFYLCGLTGTRAMAPYSNFFNLLERVFRRSWYGKVDRPLAHTPSKSHQGRVSELAPRLVAKETFVRDLWQIHQLGCYEGYEHCVFLQPEVLLEDEARLSEADREIRRITVSRTIPQRAEQMGRVRARLPAIFAEQGIPFIDMGELGPRNSAKVDLYMDYCHLTPEGAELAAAEMVESVYSLVLKCLDKTGRRPSTTDSRK